MEISEKKVALFHYTLRNKNGEILDSSDGQSPLGYIHGVGNIIPGLEKALQGKRKGDKVKVVIEPENAYGSKDDTLVQTVPITNFDDQSKVKEGIQFQVNSPEGSRVATVVKVEAGNVTVDFNHPLAGETLDFDVEITDVRDASDEELHHGHVHGEGGHHH